MDNHRAFVPAVPAHSPMFRMPVSLAGKLQPSQVVIPTSMPTISSTIFFAATPISYLLGFFLSRIAPNLDSSLE
jgi:hypothetical protein